jgi:putative oxidoreductase
MILHNLDKYRDMGLLILRVGIGIMFMYHGFPKLTAGPELWTNLGGVLSDMEIGFAPTFFGFMAALSEFGGDASHAIESAILFFSLILIGPGKYSLDEIVTYK